MEKKDPIEEARRYVANAEEVIKKAGYDPELKSYTDSKYIKAQTKKVYLCTFGINKYAEEIQYHRQLQP